MVEAVCKVCFNPATVRLELEGVIYWNLEERFNPATVRLEFLVLDEGEKMFTVSTPQRFDWNKKLYEKQSRLVSFNPATVRLE